MSEFVNARLMTENEAAEFIGMSRSFLAKSRMEGNRTGHTPGPPFVKIGRAVRYSGEDLLAWIAAHRHEPQTGTTEIAS